MIKHQSLQEKVIKGSLITLIMAFMGAVFAYLIRILFSRTLTVEEYGLFYATFGLFSMVTSYIDLGFGSSVVYFLPKYLKIKNYSQAWNIFVYSQLISLGMAVIISLILVVLAPFIATNYLKVQGSEVIIYILCGYLLGFAITNGLIQIYSGLQKPKYYASIALFKWVLTFLFAILFFSMGFSNIVFYALAWVLGYIVTALFFLLLLPFRHSFLTNNRVVWNSKIFRQMYLFALPAFIESLVHTLIIITDTFFLTLFKGVREVGIYNVVYPLSSLPIILFTPITTLLVPLVSHLMEGDKDKARYLVNRILELFPFVGLYFALFIAMFPSSVTELVFGQKWLGLVELPLTIFSFGAILYLMANILGSIVIAIGKIREKLKAVLITAIINISIGVFLIWNYGILGAVITTSTTALIMSTLFAIIVKSIIPFRIPYWLYLKFLLFSFVIWFTVRITGISLNSWTEFIIVGIIYTLIYALFGFILKIYDKNLIAMLRYKR